MANSAASSGEIQVGVGRRPGQHLALRVNQLAAAAEAGHGAREHADHVGLEHMAVPLQPGEEGQDQLGAVIGDHHLEPAAAPLAGQRGQRDLGHRHHPREHRDVVAFAQRGQVGQLAAGVVAARVVPQQVADRAQAEDLRQLVGRLGAERPGQRFAKRGHTWQHRSVLGQFQPGGRPPKTPPILGGPIPPDPPWGRPADPAGRRSAAEFARGAEHRVGFDGCLVQLERTAP